MCIWLRTCLCVFGSRKKRIRAADLHPPSFGTPRWWRADLGLPPPGTSRKGWGWITSTGECEIQVGGGAPGWWCPRSLAFSWFISTISRLGWWMGVKYRTSLIGIINQRSHHWGGIKPCMNCGMLSNWNPNTLMGCSPVIRASTRMVETESGGWAPLD